MNTKIENKDLMVNRWLNQDELCKEFGIAKATQSTYRANRMIPFSKIGKFIKYDRLKIDKWLENANVEVLNG